MRKIFYFMIHAVLIFGAKTYAQEILPSITVKNFSGKIIVSWRNEYPLEVKTINIQRSYDSTKNFRTIGSVLNPQNIENGFVDEAPPYNKMYYRVFISFDAGAYIFSESVRPVKDLPPPQPLITKPQVTRQPAVQPTVAKENNSDAFSKADSIKESLTGTTKEPGTNPAGKKGKKEKLTAGKKNIPGKQPVTKNKNNQKTDNKQETDQSLPVFAKAEPITYPSRRIYTTRDNNILINLPNFETRRYSVKFFDENEKHLFEINRVKENLLIIEKVNFLHAGWFYFEIFENGKLIEKNKFFIAK